MAHHNVSPEVRNYVDYVVRKAVTDAVRDALEEHTLHVDNKFKEQNEKINPMHQYFTTAKTNMIAIKWLVGVGGGLITAWHFVKDYFK